MKMKKMQALIFNNMTQQEERANYIVKLYRDINSDPNINTNTKIKNTSIWKLCETGGAPYQRIKKWCESKLPTLKVKEEDNEDMQLAFEQFVKCFELMKGRNIKYGDSWKVLSVQSLANLIEMKMHRIANMNTQQLDPKIEDEFIDTINYGIFGLIKLTK